MRHRFQKRQSSSMWLATYSSIETCDNENWKTVRAGLLWKMIWLILETNSVLFERKKQRWFHGFRSNGANQLCGKCKGAKRKAELWDGSFILNFYLFIFKIKYLWKYSLLSSWEESVRRQNNLGDDARSHLQRADSWIQEGNWDLQVVKENNQIIQDDQGEKPEVEIEK